MLIDGHMIATQVANRLKAALPKTPPVLAVVVVGDDPVTARFVRTKARLAQEIGVGFVVHALPNTASTEAVIERITALAGDPAVDGIVLQLPLPEGLEVDRILRQIPVAKDVDVLNPESVRAFVSGELPILPPVAGAVLTILKQANVTIAHKEVLVLGHGRLVGMPVAIFFRHNDAHVTVIDRPVSDLAEHVRESDIVVSGVGKPDLITPEMVKPHMVLIDAGTSESHGKLVGDIDPACARLVALATLVPGGVGPITVAMLFKNLLVCAQQRSAQ